MSHGSAKCKNRSYQHIQQIYEIQYKILEDTPVRFADRPRLALRPRSSADIYLGIRLMFTIYHLLLHPTKLVKDHSFLESSSQATLKH